MEENTEAGLEKGATRPDRSTVGWDGISETGTLARVRLDEPEKDRKKPGAQTETQRDAQDDGQQEQEHFHGGGRPFLREDEARLGIVSAPRPIPGRLGRGII